MEEQRKEQGKVLVVDDEVGVRMVLRRFLSVKGYAVYMAAGGKEALSMLETTPVDVVLMDINMPGMDGFDLLKAVRAAHPEIAVIMVTAIADLDIAIWALRTGALDYITKPFNFDTILISLQRALRIKRLEEENRSYREHLEEKVGERTRELERANARLEEAYHQLLHADRLATLGLLSSTVIHDVRNPLSVILGKTQILEAKLGPDHPFRAYCTDVVAQVARIEKLMEAVGHFGRKTAQAWEMVDIGGMIREALALTHKALSVHAIEVNEDYASDVPLIPGNRGELEQVMVNLLQNAAQAMAEGGQLTIRTERMDGVVKVSVSDTGVGIPAQDMDRIFEAFYTTKPEGEGTGLGLSICKRIVEEHRGHIEVESRVHQGSTFTLCLHVSRETDIQTRAS